MKKINSRTHGYCLIMKVRAFPHTQCEENLKGLRISSWVALKPLISKANQFAREHNDWTVEQWKQVMWTDESSLTLFQSDGCIRVRREVDEVMHPSCLETTTHTCGGSVMIWGGFSWSAMLCAQKLRSADNLNILNQVFPSMDFFFPDGTAYSKMTMPQFIRLKLWKSGSRSMRHHFHTVLSITPQKIFGMCWRKFYFFGQSSVCLICLNLVFCDWWLTVMDILYRNETNTGLSSTCRRPIFLLSHICLKFQKNGCSHFWQESLSSHSGVCAHKEILLFQIIISNIKTNELNMLFKYTEKLDSVKQFHHNSSSNTKYFSVYIWIR